MLEYLIIERFMTNDLVQVHLPCNVTERGCRNCLTIMLDVIAAMEKEFAKIDLSC